ncbi:GntR family transcriptional regulator [Mycetocola reblochoni]|uniref:Predicted transcriptional regulator of N-Acetylglucosamine utilization, GntR family n=2 Tax=Mycetocola reblochoni TaxID=331618 RepID=A0A1R4JXV7_9MICO|nr:GntR family transcriptional regulator [Mycetocola reblochoni]RLP70587.1 GntR family transcriptional regulator [Mycetocola reblochoni]SJN36812.1 Predicted transcriptional regulator of N-Acetylglucosamine utilization, GntR family [Mycetocola reblochoni REB411]
MERETPGREPTAATRAVRSRLRAWLAEQRFEPGERIGTERALAERLGVGRTLLRGALDELEHEGRIRRTLGAQGGVFAHDGRIQRHLNTLQGVPQMVRAQGMSVSTRVLGVQLGVPSPDEVRALGLVEGASVTRVRRLRSVDGPSWSLDLSVLPTERFPGLSSRDLSGSLYLLLAEEYGMDLGRADETVEAVPATADQAEALDIDAGAALLRVRRRAVDIAERPVEYALDLFRADRTRVHMQRYGSNWKRSRH